jgi:hypothetical protein
MRLNEIKLFTLEREDCMVLVMKLEQVLQHSSIATMIMFEHNYSLGFPHFIILNTNGGTRKMFVSPSFMFKHV